MQNATVETFDFNLFDVCKKPSQKFTPAYFLNTPWGIYFNKGELKRKKQFLKFLDVYTEGAGVSGFAGFDIEIDTAVFFTNTRTDAKKTQHQLNYSCALLYSKDKILLGENRELLDFEIKDKTIYINKEVVLSLDLPENVQEKLDEIEARIKKAEEFIKDLKEARTKLLKDI